MLAVQPSLEKVDVLVEMKDTTTVIPRNSLIEANQSGLIAEPLIDITPQTPIPDYKGGWAGRRACLAWSSLSLSRLVLCSCSPHLWVLSGACARVAASPDGAAERRAGRRARRLALQPPACLPTPHAPLAAANPLDEDCEEEGLVVCHQGRIRGERGAAAGLLRGARASAGVAPGGASHLPPSVVSNLARASASHHLCACSLRCLPACLQAWPWTIWSTSAPSWRARWTRRAWTRSVLGGGRLPASLARQGGGASRGACTPARVPSVHHPGSLHAPFSTA